MTRSAKNGRIEVICGPMFSGKTEELIRRLRRATFAKQQIVSFKHSSDRRYSNEELASHGGMRWPGYPVQDVLAMHEKISASTDIIGIDEAQFFKQELVEYAQGLADRGVRVIIAGLDQTYHGEPFGPMPELLSIAEEVTKVQAVCVQCGSSAGRSYRTKQVDGNGIIMVGAAESYEARCRSCHQGAA